MSASNPTLREYYSNLRQLFGESEVAPADQFLGGWTRNRNGVPGAVRVRRRLRLPSPRRFSSLGK